MKFLELTSSEHVEISFNIPSAEDMQELRQNQCYLTISAFSKRLTMFLPRFVTRLVKPTPYNTMVSPNMRQRNMVYFVVLTQVQ